MDKIQITLRCEDWTQENFDAFYEWFVDQIHEFLVTAERSVDATDGRFYIKSKAQN